MSLGRGLARTKALVAPAASEARIGGRRSPGQQPGQHAWPRLQAAPVPCPAWTESLGISRSMTRSCSLHTAAAFDEPAISPTEEASTPAQPSSGTRIQLRPYQEDCIETCLRELESGTSRIGVSSPTASGKTMIFTTLIEYLPPLIHLVPSESGVKDELAEVQGTRVLIIVGSVELARQAAGSCASRFPHLVVEIEQGKNEASALADVTVATYQTLAYDSFRRLDKFKPEHFKAVIVDEAHHAASHSYIRILSHFDSRVEAQKHTGEPSSVFSDTDDVASYQHTNLRLRAIPAEGIPPSMAQITELGQTTVPILGFSATFSRPDGLSLARPFQRIVWHRDWVAMIKEGWLSDVTVTMVSMGDKLNLRKVEIGAGGDFKESSLSPLLEQSDVMETVVGAWLDNAATRRSTIAFAVTVAHVMALTNAFRDAGVDARHLHAGTPAKERELLLRSFHAGEFPVLVNCAVLTEGADFPATDCVLLARPTRSPNLLLQMLGRGLRLSKETGKKNCLLLDFVGNTSSGSGLVSIPTLFGVDPLSSIQDRSVEDLERLAAAAAPFRPSTREDHEPSRVSLPATIQYRHFATVFDLIEANADVPRVIQQLSFNDWVGVGNSTFILSVRNSILRIARNDADPPEWECHFTESVGPRSPSKFARRRPTPWGSHRDLAVLVRTVDRALAERPDIWPFSLTSRYSLWKARPASLLQKQLIARKLCKDAVDSPLSELEISGIWVGKGWATRVPLDGITAGQASQLFTRLRHGGMRDAAARFKHEEKRAAKKAKSAAKSAALTASRAGSPVPQLKPR